MITLSITRSRLINVIITITITNNCNLNFKSSTNNIPHQKMTCSLLNIQGLGKQLRSVCSKNSPPAW